MFSREIQRYEWSTLRCASPTGAAGIPIDLQQLATATTREMALDAYWRIDHVVSRQGALYEVAIPTTICALSALQHSTPIGRIWLLELLTIIGNGEASSEELAVGNTTIVEICMQEVCRGIAIYFHLLEHGIPEERVGCVDLLSLCCYHDPSLKSRVIWWFKQLLTEKMSPEEHQSIEENLHDILDHVPDLMEH